MKRGALRTHIRTLADELTAAPEGLFTDAELDSFINIAQRVVYVDLIEHLPWYFRYTKTFSATASKKTYDIATDIVITDLFMFETILKNTTGEKPTPLVYLEDPEDLWQYGEVGEEKEPKVYYYEDRETVGLHPTPNSAYPYKAFYFKRIPDLTHDDSDVAPNVATPHLPEETHELIAFQVLLRWYIRDEDSSSYSRVQSKYHDALYQASYELSTSQGVTYRVRPSIKESR